MEGGKGPGEKGGRKRKKGTFFIRPSILTIVNIYLKVSINEALHLKYLKIRTFGATSINEGLCLFQRKKMFYRPIYSKIHRGVK